MRIGLPITTMAAMMWLAVATTSAQQLTIGPAASPQQSSKTQAYKRGSLSPEAQAYYQALITGKNPVEQQAAQATPSRGLLLQAGYQSSENKPSASVIKQVSASGGVPAWANEISQPAAKPAQPTAAAAKPKVTIPATPASYSQQPVSLSKPVMEHNGEKVTPEVSLQWKAVGQINVGQQATCQLLVKNEGSSKVSNVVVDAQFPATVRLLNTVPEPQISESGVAWTFEELAPGATESIEVQFIASERGPLTTDAQVRFTGHSSDSMMVYEPLLKLAIQGPERVTLGDPSPYSVTITNPGTGVAENVRIEAILPEGLEHGKGDRLILDIGSLNPQESRTLRLALTATKGGAQAMEVVATASGSLRQVSGASVQVDAPSLMVELDGPGLRYKGRNASYVANVTNTGAIATSNVRLMQAIPQGFTFVSANRGASYDAQTRILSWFVGRLEPGASTQMTIKLKADKLGEFTHFLRATSEHGTRSDAQLATRVEGTPSLVLTIADLDDPVEVGVETAYEIELTNEGTAEATNVGLSCDLPSGVVFSKGEGPTSYLTEQDLVVFKPIAKIAPGQTMTYRVFVKGNASGQLRFRARLSSDSTPEPLTSEELTRFYGE